MDINKMTQKERIVAASSLVAFLDQLYGKFTELEHREKLVNLIENHFEQPKEGDVDDVLLSIFDLYDKLMYIILEEDKNG